ncbi:MAG: bifunctional precorrin-2 dehydrogenase/sirohydrochlorin ferrochelatase [Thermodesulfovibrionales bacterium]|nr:bifunctional precorrin-2 dehydrogenase/sirohydrochlorin ferrochelatase [Thermodesulfovibrionales bacterium]
MNTFFYPAFLNIKDKNCVIIGGGRVAERKALNLLNCGAKVTIISPELTKRLKKEIQKGNIIHIDREYKENDLEGAFLVVAATSNKEINKKVAISAPFLVNVVDQPDLANFIVPSIVRRGALTIAISTSGISPAISKAIKNELNILYSKDFIKYLYFLSKFRKEIKNKLKDSKKRRQMLRYVACNYIFTILRKKGYTEAKKAVLRKLKEFSL